MWFVELRNDFRNFVGLYEAKGAASTNRICKATKRIRARMSVATSARGQMKLKYRSLCLRPSRMTPGLGKNSGCGVCCPIKPCKIL